MSKQSPSAIQNLQVNPNHATYKFVKKTYTHHWAITTVHKWSQQSSVTKQIYERRHVHEMAVIELSQTQSWQSGSDNHPNTAWQLRKPLNCVTGWSSGILKPHTCVRHDNMWRNTYLAHVQYRAPAIGAFPFPFPISISIFRFQFPFHFHFLLFHMP